MPKKQPVRMKITERALFQRIQRKLAQQGEQLRTNRSDNELGRYFIVSDRKSVTAQHQDLRKLGKQLGVIKPWEEIAE